MPKIRNTSGEDRILAAGRLVLAGAVIDVPADEVYGYTQQAIWEPVDAAAEKAHAEAEQAYREALAEDGQRVPEELNTATATKRGQKQED